MIKLLHSRFVVRYSLFILKNKSIAAGIILLLTSVGFSQQPDCWTSFRGNQALTGKTSCIPADSYKLAWTYKTGDAIQSSPVICNGTIYIGSNDGNLYSISSKGTLNWKFAAGTSIESAPLLLDNTVYFGSLEGILFALDAKTGKKAWSYKTEGQISGSPNWALNKTGKGKNLYVGSYDYNLHCVTPEGTVLWKYSSDNFINGSASIQNNQAIFGGCDGFLHIVDIQSGKLNNKIDIGNYIAASVAVSGGKAYFGNYDGEFYCVDLASKKTLWKFEGAGSFLSSPAVSGKKVIITSQDKNVYCFNTLTGAIEWNFSTLMKIDASPVIAGDKVVIASGDGRLYLLSLADGHKIWAYEVGSPMTSTPAVINGFIVVGAKDGGVYCFKP